MKRFVKEHVYNDMFHLTPDGFKSFLNSRYFSDSWDMKYNKRSRDIIYPIVAKDWENFKKLIDEYIKEEEKNIKDLGYVHDPSGESIHQVVSDWWFTLDDDEKAEIGQKEGFEEYVSEYYNEGGSKTTELTEDDWFDSLSYYEELAIYMQYNKDVNESLWSDMEERGTGDTVKAEDDIELLDKDGLYRYFWENYEYDGIMKQRSLVSKGYFYVPAFMHNRSRLVKYFVLYQDDNCTLRGLYIDIGANVDKDLTAHLREKYKIDDNNGFGSIYIYPDPYYDDDWTNQFVINVFDDIISFTNSTIVKKREN